MAVSTKLNVAQGSASRLRIDAVGDDGIPVVLTGKTLRFIAFDDYGSVVARIDGATVDASVSNRCHVQLTATTFPVADRFQWVLWDVTTPGEQVSVSRGPLAVETSAFQE